MSYRVSLANKLISVDEQRESLPIVVDGVLVGYQIRSCSAQDSEIIVLTPEGLTALGGTLPAPQSAAS